MLPTLPSSYAFVDMQKAQRPRQVAPLWEKGTSAMDRLYGATVLLPLQVTSQQIVLTDHLHD